MNLNQKLTSEILTVVRSRQQRCSETKGALRNFTKSTGKYLCQSLFFNRVAVLSPATILKKRFWYRCFPVNFPKVVRTPFLWNTSGRQLLSCNCDNEEEGAEYEAKQIRNSEWCGCSAILADILPNRCQTCNFIKKRLQNRRFPVKFTKFLTTPFFYRKPLLWWLLLGVNCVNQWKHTLKIYATEKDIPEGYF